MRIIGGQFRGLKLAEVGEGDTAAHLRPTSDRVREALFNLLQNGKGADRGDPVAGARVLDLFAGTGQMGIEALSRGAAEVVFTDENREAVALVRENLKTCGFTARVEQTESVAYLGRGEPFDLIFVDPPYDTGLIDSALQKIQNVDILSDGGIIICESRREKTMPEMSAPFAKTLERCYGKVKITVYQKGAAK